MKPYSNENPKQDPELRTYFLPILMVAGVVLIGVSAAFVVRFGGLPFSNDPADWATFGTYLGGVAGPALSFITIAFLAVQAIQERKLRNEAKDEAKKTKDLADRRIADEEMDRQRERQISRRMVYLEWLEKDLDHKWNSSRGRVAGRFTHIKNNPRTDVKAPEVWDLYDSYLAFRDFQEQIRALDPYDPISVFAKRKYGLLHSLLEKAGYKIPQTYDEIMEELDEETREAREKWEEENKKK